MASPESPVFRYLLTAYLSLTLAAGPSLCCCTVSGLKSFFTGNWAIGGCCQHEHSHGHTHGNEHGSKHIHKDLAGHHSSGSKDRGEKRAPSPTEKKECPCSQHDTCRVGAAVSLVTSTPSSLVASPFDSVATHLLPHAGQEDGAQGIPSYFRYRHDDRFLWDGGDILRACSMLRC